MSRQISLRLSPEENDRLDAELAKVRAEHGGYGPTRSEWIREAVVSRLDRDEKRREKAQAPS